MKQILNKKWTWIFLIIAFLFVGAQFIRPQVTNPPVTSEIIAPAAVKELLRKSCYDCHSNETRLAWFDKITPANWWVAADVREGRKVFNFSEWNNLSKDRQKGLLFESLNHMEFHTMPLKAYRLLHPNAKIESKEINLLRSYLSTFMKMPEADTMKNRLWDEQYAKWIRGTSVPKNVSPSPNGIDFMADYKDWVAISATERWDDGRLRIITGNDIAVNAIKNNQTNPWPDGSAFAKIAWIQVVDSAGHIGTGEFKQVAFMIKDKRTYKSTEGWGFAQWENGTDLAPHGKNVLYTSGCVNCHQPMKENDFVFTIPLNLLKESAMEDQVISLSVNKNQGTMSLLYGNVIATKFARTHRGNKYPPGAILTLVTWNQQEDSHWFGANIPGVIKSVEKLRFADVGNSISSPLYEIYGGGSLSLIKNTISNEERERTNFILNLRAAVMP